MTCSINLWLNKTTINGNVSIENLDFKLLESRVRDVDQTTFGDLGLFGAQFLEQLLNDILQVGIIMPNMRGIVLRNPKFVFRNYSVDNWNISFSLFMQTMLDIDIT